VEAGKTKEKVNEEFSEEKKENYRNFIKGLKLRRLRVREGKFKQLGKTEWLNSSDAITLEIIEHKASASVIPGGYRVIHQYILKAKLKNRNLMHIEVKYELDYESKEEMNDDIFKMFVQSSLPLHTYPYLREFVHYATLQMDLPALTLPLLKFNI